jgi:Ca2+-binding EF-hand superfamily protein
MASADAVICSIFSTMDQDGSGSITTSEMDGCFKLFDKDGDGKVSRDEWSAGFVSNFKGTPEQAEKIFKHLDKEGRGDINVDKLRELFKTMDTDGNGEVSKDEFHAFWLKMLS